MMILVSYDVSTVDKAGVRRLRQVAKACKNLGQRAQYSLFEIEANPAQWVELRARLLTLIDPKVDSLRFYFLGAEWKSKVEHFGAKAILDLGGPLIL
jgi:CRISPR-associated protein Cas2